MIDNEVCIDCEYLDFCWQNVDSQHDPDPEECERVSACALDAKEAFL